MNLSKIDWTPDTRYMDSEGELWRVSHNGHNLRSVADSEMITMSYSLKELGDLDFVLWVDWSTLPIDTKVMVSQDGVEWLPRHYAGLINGEANVWPFGATSHSKDDDRTMVFNLTKLAE